MGIRVLTVGDDLAHIEPTTEEPSSVTPQRRRRRRHANAHTSSQPHAGRSSSSSRHAKAHTSPSSSPTAPSATLSSPTSSVFGRTHLVTARRARISRRRRRRAEGQRTTMIRGKLFLLLLVTGLAVAVHADYKQNLKNRKLMTKEPIPVGSHAVAASLYLPFDEKFDSASFRE